VWREEGRVRSKEEVSRDQIREGMKRKLEGRGEELRGELTVVLLMEEQDFSQ
jgi:hypothetical protein